MIAFSTEIYDLSGNILIEDSDPSETGQDNLTRRVTRTKTLDGGVVVVDSGYAAGDRTINVVLPQPDENVVRDIQRLIKQYSTFIVCTAEGVFKAVPSGLSVNAEGNVRIGFLIKSDA